MHLTTLDWFIIVGYFAVTLGIGLAFSRKASQSLADYFISGRSLPWWIAGTSMVATTFAADTPLAVAGIVATNGLAGNWVWWALAAGGMFTVFVYARLWRRAEVMTDVELTEMRYSGKPAAALRGLRAVYVALIINPIIIGWVTGAMVTILNEAVFSEPGSIGNTTFVELRSRPADQRIPAPVAPADGASEQAEAKAGLDYQNIGIIIGCLAIVGVYATLSGLWGVAITDVIQFVMAMGGCIMLAVVAVRHVGGMEQLQQRVADNFGDGDQAFRFIPSFSDDPWMPLHIFLIYLLVQWWAVWYPGAEPGGGGYIVQRMAACKDERHTLLATLWYQVAHYCLRPWPWLLVAFVALAMYPEMRELAQGTPEAKALAANLGTKADAGFAWVMRDLSPPGLRGLMLVTFFAAFMSTISTQMNWGASYLVRDVYQRFYRPDASDAQLTFASRWISLVVLLAGAIASYLLLDRDIGDVWKTLMALGAGTGAVYMLRWFWWRINAWSEITAMLGSLGYFLFFSRYFVDEQGTATLQDEELMFLVALCTIVTWLAATWLTRPEADATLDAFYRKVRPGGPGWGPVAKRVTDIQPDQHLGASIAASLFAAGIVYFTLPAIGLLLFGKYLQAGACLVASGVCVAVVLGLMRKIGWQNAI